jgi:hypothetical protein
MSKKYDLAESITAVKGEKLTSEQKTAAQKKIAELIQEETRVVKGFFQCFETPGATVTISVKKYKGIQPFCKPMTDGCMYEIPLYVARFLNGIDVSAGALGDEKTRNPNIGTCSYGVHGFFMSSPDDLKRGQEGYMDKVGVTVVPMVGITSRKKRFGFQSTEFAGAA